MSEKRARNRSLDMAKGLMILWVVVFHLIRWDTIIQYFSIPETLFSSVMVSFFVLSGYVYQPGRRSWGESAGRRTVQLLKPYAIASLAVLAADLLWLTVSGKTNDLSAALYAWLNAVLQNQSIFILPEGDTLLSELIYGQMVAFWFIGTMMVTSLVFFAAAPLVKKSTAGAVGLAAVLLLAEGVSRVNAGEVTWPFSVQDLPGWTAAMLLGCVAGKLKLFEKCPLSRKWFLLSCIPVLALLWYLFPVTGYSQDMGGRVIWNPAARIMMSFLQLYVMVFGFQLLKESNPAARFFGWLGRNTLTVLLYHMLLAAFVSLATGLYFLCDWGFLTSAEEMFSTPENAALQGLGLLAITAPLCLLLCLVRERVLKKLAEKKKASSAG